MKKGKKKLFKRHMTSSMKYNVNICEKRLNNKSHDIFYSFTVQISFKRRGENTLGLKKQKPEESPLFNVSFAFGFYEFL